METTTGTLSFQKMSVRVLLVDDDARLHELLTSYLEQNGVHVTKATNGTEGLAKLESGTFDAVLLDVMMPRMTGPEVLRAMREDEDLRSIPVIILTAVAPAVVRDLLGGAPVVVLPKPVSLGDLDAAIRAARPR